MYQKIGQRIAELFYEYPDKQFTIREISGKVGISKTTSQRYLKMLQEEKIVSSENQANDSFQYRIRKICFFLQKITDSGLIEALVDTYNPSCIILFGSIRKGDSTRESDIDLFIESPISKSFNYSRYEKMLGHTIQVFLRKDIKSLQKHLFNNVVNGIKLYGAFKIK